MRSNAYRYRTAPAATIAMVTYNSGRYVGDAIRSALAQDLEDFELVVCDDCSTDDTWAIVGSFGDRRIRAVRNQTNIGEYRNRNQALALARGKYVIYVDGDDVIYPHGLRVMVRTMESFPYAAFGGCLPPSEKFMFPVQLTAKQYCSCSFFGPIVLASNFTQLIFRTDALRAVGGFDLRYRTGDLHIQYVLGSRHNVVLMAAGLAWWRKHSGQASESLTANGGALVEVWKYCREMLEAGHCPFTPGERRLALDNLNRMLLRNAVKMVLRRQPMNAVRMALATRIPWSEWHCLLSPYRKPYLEAVTGADPIRSACDDPRALPKIAPVAVTALPRAAYPPAVAVRRPAARVMEAAD